MPPQNTQKERLGKLLVNDSLSPHSLTLYGKSQHSLEDLKSFAILMTDFERFFLTWHNLVTAIQCILHVAFTLTASFIHKLAQLTYTKPLAQTDLT